MPSSDRRHTDPEFASKGTCTNKSGTNAPEDAALHLVSYSPSIFVMQLFLFCVDACRMHLWPGNMHHIMQI